MNESHTLQHQAPINFDYIHGCLHLLNDTLNELKILSKLRLESQIHLVNTLMVINYRRTLVYMFISEYCKLLETKHYNESENFASLEKLNHHILNEKKDDYFSFGDIKQKIGDLRGSAFYQKIKHFRNTKVAHTDKASEPYNLPAFKAKDLVDATKEVEKLIQICNICSVPYNIHFVFHNDDMTDITLNEYGLYYHYYHKNLPQSYKDTH